MVARRLFRQVRMAATAPRAEPARTDAPPSWQRPARGTGRAAGTGGPPAGEAIRRLAAIDGAHPKLTMADVVGLLWTTLLKFDAADPGWPDRDRFVLCADPGGLLLRTLLRLTGHASADHPAGFPPIQIKGGPNGQALATTIGLALAERMLAARFGRSLVDHRTWVVASEPDLGGGLSHEAICLAGELRLGRLAVLYDATDAPPTDLAKRFNAAGWAVRDIGGHDTAAVASALSFAQRGRRPSLIVCRTHESGHATPLAPRADTVAKLPEDLLRGWSKAGQRGAAARRAWLKRLAQHPLRAEFERAQSGRRPDEWRDAVAALRPDGTSHALDALLQAVPELLGCTADRAAETPAHGHDPYRARRLGFGRREHGMAAAMNGMALHGGWLPVGRSPACASDALRPALRLAAITRQQVIHLVTPSDQETGEDRPAQPPAEHLAGLRAIPDVMVFRPADAAETIECWELALRRADGPCVIFLPDQPVPPLPRAGTDNHTARGGYVLIEPAERRRATLIATGPEVAVALAAQAALAADGLPVAVVSLPCWEAFAAQDDAYRALVLGSAPRIGIEAACGFGWERWLGTEGRFIGSTGMGAPAGLYNHFGITPDTVIAAVRALAGRP
jgi:transketolase